LANTRDDRWSMQRDGGRSDGGSFWGSLSLSLLVAGVVREMEID